MNFNIRKTIMIFVGSMFIALPVGAIAMTDGIKKSDAAMNPLVQNASALAPKTEVKAEEPKTEPTPAVELVAPTPEPTPEPAPVVVAPPSPYIAGNCESFRPLVQKYFGAAATNGAMIVMSHESGCDPNAVSATDDYGLFQLNGIRVFDPEENVRIAYQQKFVTPRRGTTPNFSAWYAVCTPDLVPKYAGIWCS